MLYTRLHFSCGPGYVCRCGSHASGLTSGSCALSVTRRCVRDDVVLRERTTLYMERPPHPVKERHSSLVSQGPRQTSLLLDSVYVEANVVPRLTLDGNFIRFHFDTSCLSVRQRIYNICIYFLTISLTCVIRRQTFLFLRRPILSGIKIPYCLL